MRVELRDGQWAELRERITHGQDKVIQRMRAQDDVELRTVTVREFVVSWRVNDVEGIPIRLEDADAIDRCPSDIADLLFARCAALYRGATRPNPLTPPSSDDSSSPAAS